MWLRGVQKSVCNAFSRFSKRLGCLTSLDFRRLDELPTSRFHHLIQEALLKQHSDGLSQNRHQHLHTDNHLLGFLITYFTLRCGGWFPNTRFTTPFLIASIFSMAFCDRILFCPTRNTTVSKNFKA